MAEKPYEDYGHLYRKDPAAIEQPGDIESLARLLRRCNAEGRFVTLRNTAHSTNGQTLTRDVQVNLSGLSYASFNRDNMSVIAGAGASWNTVLRAVRFPQFALPLFPNNPGQRIHIGGTAGVGGVGYYGSHVGGFWNCVRSFKLVTMTGDILECSRDRHPDYFRYALAGFGRLGVIAEMTVDVVPSKAHVLGMLLIYRCGKEFEQDMLRAMDDPEFNGVAAQEDIPSRASFADQVKTSLDLKIMTVIKEVEPDDASIKEIARRVRIRYPCGIMLFMKVKNSNLDVSLEPTTFEKRELVYFSPRAENFFVYLVQRACQLLTGGLFRCLPQLGERRGTKHPWNDCIVPLERYGDFMGECKRIIVRHGFKKYISKQSIFHGLVNVDSFVTFLIRKRNPYADEFPVALDLPGERKVSMGLAIMPDLPPNEVDRLPSMLEMCDELTDLTYAMGGRRYLYGYHRLSTTQLRQHYGDSVIRHWNGLKRELDPKGLLNIGVISRQLDEFPV